MAILRDSLAVLHRTAFRARYAWRSRAWQPADLRPRPALDRIVVSGFFEEPLGIGRAGHLCAEALDHAGAHIIREDLRPFDRGLLTRPPAPFPQGRDATAWLIHANPPEARIALFGHDEAAWRDLYRIGCWAWESDRAPDDWADMARWFHEIWVPSAFVRDALSAVMTPLDAAKLRVVPLRVDVPAATPPRPDGPVTALTLFDPRSSFARKNPAGAIAAWKDAVPHPSDQARLIVKTLGGAEHHPQYKALTSLADGRSDIQFMAQTLSDGETRDLIHGCDILISLHRGEGFGLPLAEAMAAGVCVLATGWSGNMEFMTEDTASLVPCDLVPADPAYNGQRAQWAEPRRGAAADPLRALIRDKALRLRLGTAARTHMIQFNAALDDQMSTLVRAAG